jgi:hypothetical protein
MIGYFDSSVILAILFNEEKQIERIITMKISGYIVLILICTNLLLTMDF